MPYSARENDSDVRAFVEGMSIKSVLDVGAGSGTYGKLLKDLVDVIDAAEIWDAYINEFDLTSIYRTVHLVDVRTLSRSVYQNYDLVIFGDVLEHMSRENSLTVWNAAHGAKYGLISVPIIHYPQGAEFGNPHEAHVQEHLTPENIRSDYGPFVFDKCYDVTGTFIKEFTS